MTDEQLQTELAEVRDFALAAPLLRPMLERRKKLALTSLLTDFRQGERDLTVRIAELSVLDGLERELEQKENIHNTLQEKQNARRNRK